MNIAFNSPANKTLILGTALWGWGVNRVTAHKILDHYVANGGRLIDTASNYPINKRPEDFGMAANWIADWIAVNGADVLSVLVKIGATDNMGGPDSNLESSFILQSEEFFRERFGAALTTIAVHWDNRGDNEGDADVIAESVAALSQLNASGISIGFSGVRHPELYLKAAPSLADQWWIQVKENAQTNTARFHYSKAFPNARYIAYGINMGGIKLSSPSKNSSLALRSIKRPNVLIDQLSKYLASDHGLRPPPTNLNPALSGIIIGPRTTEQIEITMPYWKKLNMEATAEMITYLPTVTSAPV
jgi:hypothetical protein